jgi:hypothetical protein
MEETTMRKIFSILVVLATNVPVQAADFSFDGYADVRIIAPSGQISWLDGGLGKLRYGEGDSNLQFAEITGEGRVLVTPELSAVTVLRIEPEQRTFVDVLETYVRYRPNSITPFRWSVKVGAFFSPISLENTEIGWTSYWTLTPSALNSWVGEELRTIGSEGQLEWRRDSGTVALTGAVFGWNDPAGVLIAERGWALDDRPTGLFDHLRRPDAQSVLSGDPAPLVTPVFQEIDHRPGWYAGLNWDETGLGSARILYYNNNGNVSKESNDVYTWQTTFWSAGFKTQIDNFTLLTQGLTGRTIIVDNFRSVTDYDAAYVLLGWEQGNWRLAARADVFETRQHNPGPPLGLSETGYAGTASIIWLPRDWLRLTAELLCVDSTRHERAIVDLHPRQVETQMQLSGRVYF